MINEKGPTLATTVLSKAKCTEVITLTKKIMDL